MIQHGLRCLKCKDEIYSNHRHYFRRCKCGAIYIDGGLDYMRCGGDLADMENISREVKVVEMEVTLEDLLIEEARGKK